MSAMTLVESRTGEVVFEGHRVTPRKLCPVCGHNSWCLVDTHRGLAICPRVESPKKIGEAGWMHSVGGSLVPESSKFIRPHGEVLPLEDADRLQARFVRQGSNRLGLLAMELGLSLVSLERLEVGWNGSAWTFPMRNHRDEIVGFRTRLESGQKLSIKGSRSGLFIPRGAVRVGTVWVVEGPTDVAAMIDLDFNVIGRPSCRGSEQEIARWTKGMNVIIVSDNDSAGVGGAESLVQTLRGLAKHCLIVLPPMGMKDARQSLNQGGQRSDWLELIGVTEQPRSTYGRKA